MDMSYPPCIAPETEMSADRVDDGRHHIKYDFWGISNGLSRQVRPPLKSLMHDQVFWLDERSLILWNQEVGKWPLFLQKYNHQK
ncbi:MAG: hypothetical protein ACP5JG_04550 [Anaerolineae bacterium]